MAVTDQTKAELEPAVPQRVIPVVVIMPDQQLQCGLRVEEAGDKMGRAAAAAGKRAAGAIELTATSEARAPVS